MTAQLLVLVAVAAAAGFMFGMGYGGDREFRRGMAVGRQIGGEALRAAARRAGER